MKKLVTVFILFLAINIGLKAQWYNLQWPPTANITEGDSVDVYAQIWIDGVTNAGSPGAGISAWIGVYSTNTDPSTWPDSVWKTATFSSDVGNNDEFKAAIGSNLAGGTYYYASRFLHQPLSVKESGKISGTATYWYGGTGGIWNNDNGVLTVNAVPTIGWGNLQWPPNASILEGDSVNVYAQVYMDGITNTGSPGAGISAWIGVSNSNNNPAAWPDTAWKTANFNTDVGNNDEFTASIGSNLTEGTYYYASRFLYSPSAPIKENNKVTNGYNYYYGGYNGGAWDSTNNISGVLTVSSVPDTVIDWANLQWPPTVEINKGATFTVYGQIYEESVTEDTGKGHGIEAWFGLSTEDTDPSTWSDSAWFTATYNLNVGNNDEFTAELDIVEWIIQQNLTEIPYQFYYAARYRLNSGNYYYGGFQNGAWDGETNVNGIGSMQRINFNSLGWCNLQWPPTMNLQLGEEGTAYAQLWIDGVTSQEGPTSYIQAFIGVNNENTDPVSWTDAIWYPAIFNTDVGNNDEFMADIGSELEPGTYYYASRFVTGIKTFYGGYNEGGGGFWDGVNNISGVLTISSDIGPTVDWCNLQWPPEGNINEGDEFIVYTQAWKADVTNLEGATEGLTAWIGVSTENTNPAEWNDDAWQSASFNVDVGNNDEFMLDIGSNLASGTYYYTSRFQLEEGPFTYGGYNSGGGGFWDGTTNISGTLVVDPVVGVEDEEVPTVYALEQNYPNPFNPATTIRFSIPSQSNVKLKIYNIMGEEVALLNNGILQTGIHQISWNASHLSSGVYLLRIEAVSTENGKEFIDMKKMMLMK